MTGEGHGVLVGRLFRRAGGQSRVHQDDLGVRVDEVVLKAAPVAYVLADQLCITDDYLSRIVKRVSGRTVGDMINQMLMMEACYLLRTSSLSIAQISQRLHFSEPASFTRFFIRVKGMTPKEFRNKAVHT